MRRFTFFLVVPLLAACAGTSDSTAKTGLFDDDVENLIMAFDQIEPQKTNKGNLEEMGFDLKAPNVQHLPGPDAMKAIFGEQAFNSALSDKDKIEPLLAEMNHYEMYAIPYKEITTETDRFYFSDKETRREGVDALLTVVLKDGVVIYRGKRYRNIDETESDSGFAQGLINVLRDIAGIGNFARQVEKLTGP